MSELSRLRWLCRRGMKELDVVMTRYLETRYSEASEVDKESFKRLLEMQDPDLYALLLGQVSCPDNQVQNLVNTLRTQSRVQ
ncbi:MAG: antitoxin CptB [Gammaproteobacteria bacterium]|jgi:antitoxin CptB